MSHPKFTESAEKVQRFFEKYSTELGQTTGFVRRVSKMTARVFVQVLVLGLLEKGTSSLNELVEVSRELGVDISESGLMQRFNAGGAALLQGLFERGMKLFSAQQGVGSGLLASFSRVNIIDSTQLSLPAPLSGLFRGSGGSASSAGAKLQVCYEYQHGTLSMVELGAACVPDQSSTVPLQCAAADSLTLVDLGYFKQALLVALSQRQAFFLVRLNTQTSLYWQAEDTHPADVLAALQASDHSCGEMAVYVGAQARVGVRLIYQKLPSAVVAQRHRQAHANAHKKGRTCSARHLAWLAWTVYLTNVPVSVWTPPQAILTYRLRWHIELLFKLWKSQARLDLVRCRRPESFRCILYARLLGLLIFHWLVAPYRFPGGAELSLTKALHAFQHAMPRWRDAIRDGWSDFTHVLARFMRLVSRLARATARRNRPSTRQRLLDLAI
jgi:hypothetical protein